MKLLPLAVAAVFITGCASKNIDRNEAFQMATEKKVEKVDEVISNIPSWYLESECSGPGICGVGSSISPDLQNAINIARVEAMSKLAETIKTEASSIRQSYKESLASGGAVIGRDKQIIDLFSNKVDLSGAEISKKEIFREDANFRVYIEAFYPLGDANYIKKETDAVISGQTAQVKADSGTQEILARIKE
jgi:hypothetical protein